MENAYPGQKLSLPVLNEPTFRENLRELLESQDLKQSFNLVKHKDFANVHRALEEKVKFDKMLKQSDQETFITAAAVSSIKGRSKSIFPSPSSKSI